MRIDVIHIQTQTGDITTVKTLIATFSLSAALLAPLAAFAATTTAASTAPVATTPVDSQSKTNAARVAMNEQSAKNTGFGRQANDDRQGLSRIVEQSHQLGATN